MLDAIVAHAREDAPNECCGLLIGSPDVVTRSVRARNLRAGPTTFLIDPAAHFESLKSTRGSSLAVRGVYHSHPRTPAVPSESDLAGATYPDYVYVIVALEDPAVPTVSAFRLEGGNFEVLDLVTVE